MNSTATLTMPLLRRQRDKELRYDNRRSIAWLSNDQNMSIFTSRAETRYAPCARTRLMGKSSDAAMNTCLSDRETLWAGNEELSAQPSPALCGWDRFQLHNQTNPCDNSTTVPRSGNDNWRSKRGNTERLQ